MIRGEPQARLRRQADVDHVAAHAAQSGDRARVDAWRRGPFVVAGDHRRPYLPRTAVDAVVPPADGRFVPQVNGERGGDGLGPCARDFVQEDPADPFGNKRIVPGSPFDSAGAGRAMSSARSVWRLRGGGSHGTAGTRPPAGRGESSARWDVSRRDRCIPSPTFRLPSLASAVVIGPELYGIGGTEVNPATIRHERSFRPCTPSPF